MNVTARIEEVIASKGLTKSKVAEKMGKFNQAFNRLITTPKWETIELVAQAIGITTEELLFGNLEELSSTIESDEKVSHNHSYERTDQSPTIGMLVCPNCGKGIRLNIEAISKP